MRNDISFVCSGQGAGNFGILLQRAGFNVMFINTAQSDLDVLKGAAHTYKLPNIEGCNQDQTKAKSALSVNANTIISKLDQVIKSKMIYFVFSAGGGTGGGMSPLMAELYAEHLKSIEDKEWEEFELAEENGTLGNRPEPVHRVIGFITIIPGTYESVMFNANGYKCLGEVIDLTARAIAGDFDNIGSTFLVDNDNVKEPIKLNKEFVSMFKEFVSIPSSHKDVRGNVDEADLTKALTEPGVCILSKTGKDYDISELLKNIKNSQVFAPIEDKVGVYWVSSTTDTVNTDAIEKELGAPKAHFKTYNDSCNYFMVSGLGFPTERLSLMAERAKEYNNCTRNSKQDIVNTYLEENLSFLDEEPVLTRRRRGLTNSNVSDDSKQDTIAETVDVQPQTVEDKLAKFRRRRG